MKNTTKHHQSKTAKPVDENRLLVVAIIIALIAILIINTVYLIIKSSQSTDTAATSSQVNASRILTSLQTATSATARVRVSNVTENDKMDYAFTLDPTQTMLILNVSVTNLTTKTQSLYPDSQFYVRTEQSSFSMLHPSMYVTHPLSVANLKPGQTASGQLSFAVSKQAARPLLYVDTGWNAATPIVFDVLH